MFQHILVPLDGSSRAERALPVAARLAQASGSTVVLLRVVSPPTVITPYPAEEPITFQATINADLEEARNYLKSITNVSSLSDVHTETEVLLGQPAAAILSVAETRHINLIVLSSHGYTSMKHRVMGSTAEKVADSAPAPVLLLRAEGPAFVGTHPHEGPSGTWRVLIPLDGSERAKAVIVPSAQLVAALAAPGPGVPGALHFTRVVILPVAEQISQIEREAIVSNAKEYLSTTVEDIRYGRVASPVADLQLTLTRSVTIDDDIVAGIVRVAEEGEEVEGAGVLGKSDVIAIATHGYGGLDQWAMDSITERVLQVTSLPLLIVRPPETIEMGSSSSP